MEYNILDLKKLINNKGLASEDNFKSASLTMSGSSIPNDKIPLNKEFYFNGIPFYITETEKGDNIELEGQIIELNEVISSNYLYILGLSVYGDYFEDITFLLHNEIIKKEKLSFNDYLTEEPFFTNNLVFQSQFTYNNISNNFKNKLNKPIIWCDKITFKKNIKYNKIELGDNPCMHIFAMTSVKEN
ncbi:hypothetical protein [Oceanobacillus sp. CFH 90083]|uniref:hypothetical protein n=1 Tax=Oceanobacillus sp. CFH 90083 TaxID=2592336 RepID=UPI00128D1516|nr:hypothetical protein [Oceanobacillus sp. CFH 90083]